ncbi:MAG: ArsR/SmtB family transcription factor [Calditrichaceae bacterium]
MSPIIEICSENAIDRKKVERIQKEIPEEPILQDLGQIFAVLSDPTRLKIITALTMDELCVCDIAATINMSISAVSHQLRILKTSRLVTFRKQGKNVYYVLDDDHVKELLKIGHEHVTESGV